MPQTQTDYVIELDPRPGVAQGEERFVVRHDDGTEQQIRVKDYELIYPIPGLYEEVVQRRLECSSPQIIVERLADAVAAADQDPADVRVLDVGAGNGVIGEGLRDAGFRVPVGSDALVEARDAAERDRPGLYAEYVIDDGTPDAFGAIEGAVRRHELNALTCASALGPGHIPIERLVAVWGLLPAGSLIALTASTALVADWGGPQIALNAVSGDDAPTEVVHHEQFRHRLLVGGGSVDYDVIVGRKPIG
ncbi:MAG: hypothetical protein ITG02_06450 [Patulibacter sp.]|nr:hypothetical protein [Patulibacter sp.]